MTASADNRDYMMMDFSGGWNTRRPPVLLAPNEFELADNVRPLPTGGFQKRLGYTLMGNNDSNTSIVTGLTEYRTVTGTRYLIRTKNSKIEYMDTGSTWTDITGALTPTTTGDVKHVFATFRGSVVGTNGTDVPWKWAGTGNAAAIAQAIGGGADTIDKCAALCMHRERLVLGDVTATESAVQTRYESVIWPSDAGTLDTWSASPTGKIHLGQGDGDSITCMLSMLGYLIVFKRHSLWRVSDYGVTDTQVALKVANVGTPSKHGACIADGKIWFFSEAGLLYSYDPRQGDSPDALVEHTRHKIGDWNISKITTGRLAYAHLTFDPQHDELLFFNDDASVSATTPAQSTAWVYNIASGAWARWYYAQRINVSTFGWDGGNTTYRHTLLYGTHNGFVVSAGLHGQDTTSSSTAITMTAYLAPIHCGAPGTNKKWNYAYVFTNSVQLGQQLNDAPTADTITLVQDNVLPADDSTGGDLTDSLTMSAQAGATTTMYDSVEQAELSGHSKWTRFRLSHTSTRRILVAGLMINYDLRGPRRPV